MFCIQTKHALAQNRQFYVDSPEDINSVAGKLVEDDFTSSFIILELLNHSVAALVAEYKFEWEFGVPPYLQRSFN